VPAARTWCHDNYPETDFDAQDADWTEYLGNCYPSLCPFLSKHPEVDEDPFTPGNQSNDTAVPAFHDPFATSSYAFGRIEKFGIDVGDIWAIDLAVPCFENHCAQDWPDFVTGINPDADPEDYKLPIEFEHEVFGCDLWFEVTDIF